MSFAEVWRAARPPAAGLHLDSAACSRQSHAAMDAAARHARHEAELGGYVAAEAAAPVLDAGRAAVAALTGMSAAGVEFSTGSRHALDLLLSRWPAAGRTLACLPGEYGPNLAIMAAHGFTRRMLPVDGTGRLVLDEAAATLAADPPDLVHLTPVSSHRGLVQPLAGMARICTDAGCRWWSTPPRRWARSTARSAARLTMPSIRRRASGWPAPRRRGAGDTARAGRAAGTRTSRR